MSNLKHYIDELIKGNSFFTAKLICKYCIYVLSGLHFLNAMLFLCAGNFVLLSVHLIAAALIITTLTPMIDKDSLISVYLITLTEIIAMVFFSTLTVGWDSGFHSYLISAVSTAFYFTYVNQKEKKKNHSLPLMLSLIVILCYFIDFALMKYIDPIFPVKKEFWLVVLNVFNTACAFAIMIVFSYLFVWEIQSKSNELTRQNEKLDELAHKDPLTRLLNRRCMNEILNERMELLKRSGKRFTMVLGDIDDFKRVNDTYGHDAGDLVLVTVANTILSTVGKDDAVCRWGGEEILILVQEPMETAATTAERIRRNIEEKDIVFEDKMIRITMTFGIAESIPGYRIEHLIQQADDKLYYGKKHGKNQVVFLMAPDEEII
ncbi:MAG: GGDEF domain-containing protein [Lachnospiraceae bacterium]|nr:GGDEF domain-containing protein [Lachnospiraceae bacterium]